MPASADRAPRRASETTPSATGTEPPAAGGVAGDAAGARPPGSIGTKLWGFFIAILLCCRKVEGCKKMTAWIKKRVRPMILSYIVCAIHSQLILIAFVREHGFPGGKVVLGVLASCCTVLGIGSLALGYFVVGVRPKAYEWVIIAFFQLLKIVLLSLTWVGVPPTWWLFLLGVASDFGSALGTYLANRERPPDPITAVGAFAAAHAAFCVGRFQDVITYFAAADAALTIAGQEQREVLKALTRPLLEFAKLKMEQQNTSGDQAMLHIAAIMDGNGEYGEAERYFDRIRSESETAIATADRLLV